MGRHNDHNIKDVFTFYEEANPRIKKGLDTVKVLEIWHEVMGTTISGYTQKVSFHEGNLKVYLTSAPLKKELLAGKEKIISLLNDALDQPIIRTVEIY